MRGRDTTGVALEALTEEAVRAADSGCWDRVQDCYARRAELLTQAGFEPIAFRRLRELDAYVYERVRVARDAAQQSLIDIVRLRRTIMRLAASDQDSAEARRVVDGLI